MRKIPLLYYPLPLGEGWERDLGRTKSAEKIELPLPLGEGWGEGLGLETLA